MAVYKDEYQDELKQCPYNSCHMIASRRFQIHVSACEKKQGPGWSICRFNQSHRMPSSQKKDHESSCPDARQTIREVIERHQMRAADQAAGPSIAGSSFGGSRHHDQHHAEPERPRSTARGFRALPVIGLSNPAASSDPWADEGMAANQQNFRIKGLGDEFDAEAFVNNVDPDAYVDPICLQRLSRAQRKTYYENRGRALAEKREKTRMQELQQQRQQQQQQAGGFAAGHPAPGAVRPAVPATTPTAMDRRLQQQPYVRPQTTTAPANCQAPTVTSDNNKSSNDKVGTNRFKSWAQITSNPRTQ